MRSLLHGLVLIFVACSASRQISPEAATHQAVTVQPPSHDDLSTPAAEPVAAVVEPKDKPPCQEDEHGTDLSRIAFGDPDGMTAYAFLYTVMLKDGQPHRVSCLSTPDHCSKKSCTDFTKCCDRGVKK